MVNEVVQRDAAVAEVTSEMLALHRSLRSLAQRDLIKVEGLRRPDIPLLRQLADHGPMRPGSLADRLGVGPSVVSRQLATLVADEMVTRRSDPLDARADLIAITDQGRSRMNELWSEFVSYLAERVGDWSEDDLATLAQLMKNLNNSVNPCYTGNEPEGA